MNVLHICNDYLGSKVHENLYLNLASFNIRQTIFYPFRKSKSKQLQDFEKKFDHNLLVSKPLKGYHRVLFRSKIRFLFFNLSKESNLKNFDMLHATTLFSDGAVALMVKKKFKIPFIVAVRSTDIDTFLRFRPDLILIGLEVLKEASAIIFISTALKERFLNHPLIFKQKLLLLSKCLVINNGIDSFWLNNRLNQKKQNANKILYVGSLIKRKNILELTRAVLELNEEGVNCNLSIIGGGGYYQKKVKMLSEKYYPKINYLGVIKNQNELRNEYNLHGIFALPSKSETFGLVYLEALSQGKPVLCSKNEGIDGLFDFKVGEFVHPNSILSIKKGLKKIMDNYSTYQIDKIDFTDFNWQNISKTYFTLYQKTIRNNK